MKGKWNKRPANKEKEEKIRLNGKSKDREMNLIIQERMKSERNRKKEKDEVNRN